MLQEVGKMRKSCRHFCLLFCMNCSWQSVKLLVPEKLATYLSGAWVRRRRDGVVVRPA